jgi:hypothetical protein
VFFEKSCKLLKTKDGARKMRRKRPQTVEGTRVKAGRDGSGIGGFFEITPATTPQIWDACQ